MDREPAKGGFEQDAFSKWRRLLCMFSKPGVAKAAKRQYNKRARKARKLRISKDGDT